MLRGWPAGLTVVWQGPGPDVLERRFEGRSCSTCIQIAVIVIATTTWFHLSEPLPAKFGRDFLSSQTLNFCKFTGSLPIAKQAAPTNATPQTSKLAEYAARRHGLED